MLQNKIRPHSDHEGESTGSPFFIRKINKPIAHYSQPKPQHSLEQTSISYHHVTTIIHTFLYTVYVHILDAYINPLQYRLRLFFTFCQKTSFYYLCRK